MRRILIGASLTGAAAFGLASAQTPTWSAPALGYFYEAESKSLRPIFGVPGASTLDASLASASKLDLAAIAANRTFAIAQGNGADHLLLITLAQDGGIVALDGTPATAYAISISTNGQWAAILSSDQQQVQVWRGLPGQPELDRTLATAALNGLVISDDGLVAGWSGNDVRLVQDGEGKVLAQGSFKALSFRPGTHDLAAADQGQNQILLISGVDADASTTAVLQGQDGIAGPAALAFSADGQYVLCGNALSRTIVMKDLQGGSTVSLDCGCDGSTLQKVDGNAVFEAGSNVNGLVLFDADTGSPRILTIPGSSAVAYSVVEEGQ